LTASSLFAGVLKRNAIAPSA